MNSEKYEIVFQGIMKLLQRLEFEEALQVLGGLTNMLMHSVEETDKRADIMGNWIASLMDAEINLQQWEHERRRGLH